MPSYGVGGYGEGGYGDSSTVVNNTAMRVAQAWCKINGVAVHVGDQVEAFDTDVLETRDVVPQPDPSDTIVLAQPFTQPPAQDQVYIFGEKESVGKKFRVFKIGRGQDMAFRIDAAEYSDEVYAEDDPAITGAHGALPYYGPNFPRQSFDNNTLWDIGGVITGNFLDSTQDFDNPAIWNFNSEPVTPIITPNAVTDPSGNLNAADKITFPSSGTFVDLFQDVGGLVNIKKQFCFSIWLRADAPTGIVMLIADFSPTTQVPVQVTKSITTSWVRYSVTGAFNSTPNPITRCGLRKSTINSQVSVYAWGAQLEYGSVPTPYIPHGGSVPPPPPPGPPQIHDGNTAPYDMLHWLMLDPKLRNTSHMEGVKPLDTITITNVKIAANVLTLTGALGAPRQMTVSLVQISNNILTLQGAHNLKVGDVCNLNGFDVALFLNGGTVTIKTAVTGQVTGDYNYTGNFVSDETGIAIASGSGGTHTLKVGYFVGLSLVTKATFLNNQVIHITAVTSTTVTAAFTHADYGGSTGIADTGFGINKSEHNYYQLDPGVQWNIKGDAGFPWDIQIYDDKNIYLSVTEYDWANASTGKIHQSADFNGVDVSVFKGIPLCKRSMNPGEFVFSTNETGRIYTDATHYTTYKLGQVKCELHGPFPVTYHNLYGGNLPSTCIEIQIRYRWGGSGHTTGIYNVVETQHLVYDPVSDTHYGLGMWMTQNWDPVKLQYKDPDNWTIKNFVKPGISGLPAYDPAGFAHNGGGQPELPLPITIDLTPPSAGFKVGDTQVFAADVQNASNPAVTWSVIGGVGTITSTGKFTATAIGPGEVVATSVQNPTITGRAPIAIGVVAPPPPPFGAGLMWDNPEAAAFADTAAATAVNTDANDAQNTHGLIASDFGFALSPDDQVTGFEIFVDTLELPQEGGSVDVMGVAPVVNGVLAPERKTS